MDGKRTFQEIWDRAVEHLGDDAPTQDQMIRLASQLHSNDTLLCDVPPDTFELFQRYESHQKMKWKQWFTNPLSIRFPLFDPERLLNQLLPWVRPFLGWFGVSVWCMVVGYALYLSGLHWDGLTKNVSDQILTPENLLLLWLVYPLVKLIHEFGHAFATKNWGGEVHEIGIMFLVFIPVPYVEASSASAFREKHRRMMVDAAGIIVEFLLAAIAVVVWVHVEQGIVHAIAYNVILIGSVSTLFFNGNPLLRFDGYYFLADAIEVPNLGSRSNNYLGYLIQRYLFGIKSAKSPANTSGERFWMLFYGVSSFFYRMFIVAVIALVVAEKFFIVGVLLAVWAMITMLGVPLFKRIKFLLASPSVTGHRVRAIMLTTSFIVLLLGFIIFAPFPYATRAEGVIWPPEDSMVRAGTNGFCREILVKPDQWVQSGDPIMISDDPLLKAEKKILKARLQELQARYLSLRYTERSKAMFHKEEIVSVEKELNRIKELESQLTIRSQVDGKLILPRSEDMKGRFIRRGELVGYVIRFPLNTVRVVVPQDNIGLVKDQTVKIQIRLAEKIGEVSEAKLLREVPAATEELPSVALGFAGGGEVPVDPQDKEGTKAFDSIFQLDLILADQVNMRRIGERVFVRFDHGEVPLIQQWYYFFRQLFLRRFSV
jgi:putative peptide zinc metalloprotease protein